MGGPIDMSQTRDTHYCSAYPILLFLISCGTPDI